MKEYLSKLKETTEFIKSKINNEIDYAIILGSGLGPLVEVIEEKKEIEYAEIPNFPQTTIVGHDGKLVFGKIGNKNVLAMKGRFHYYEGHDMNTVTFAVRVFKLLGIENLIVTNAAGGANKEFKPGDLMLISDHIGFYAPSALRGSNVDDLGTRFPDMSEVYSKEHIEKAKKVADKLGIEIKSGVYMFAQGPMYETPAEIRMVQKMGVDAVGMSTVPEVIAAKHCGMNILGISCITNMASGILNQPLSHEEVGETAKLASQKFTNLVSEFIKTY